MRERRDQSCFFLSFSGSSNPSPLSPGRKPMLLLDGSSLSPRDKYSKYYELLVPLHHSDHHLPVLPHARLRVSVLVLVLLVSSYYLIIDFRSLHSTS